MIWWKQYVLSVIASVLLCKIVMHLITDLRYRRLVQLIGGTFLAVTILNPILSAEIDYSPELDIGRFSPDEYVNSGKLAAIQEQEQGICNACESYIANKAKALGAAVTAEVFLDEMLHPNSARLYIQTGSEHQKKLEQILEADLGITKENQAWIWNQEESSW